MPETKPDPFGFEEHRTDLYEIVNQTYLNSTIRTSHNRTKVANYKKFQQENRSDQSILFKLI
eukprot:scaffold10220_cov272-Chaetoceros_neogracile.AAC.27